MPKYLLHMIGRGEGCDYTIGCNLIVQTFEAPSDEEARAFAFNALDDEGAITDDERVKDALLYRVDEVPLGLQAARDAYQEAGRAEEKARAEAAERAEFERLKKKFG